MIHHGSDGRCAYMQAGRGGGEGGGAVREADGGGGRPRRPPRRADAAQLRRQRRPGIYRSTIPPRPNNHMHACCCLPDLLVASPLGFSICGFVLLPTSSPSVGACIASSCNCKPLSFSFFFFFKDFSPLFVSNLLERGER